MVMIRLLKTCLLLFLFSSLLSAHEQWLATDFPSYVPGDTIIVRLQSGHTLGSSDFLISSKLIQEVLLFSPTGQQTKLELQPAELEYVGNFVAVTAGTWTVRVHLRKRRQGPWVYLLQHEIQVGSSDDPLPQLPVEELEVQTDSSFSVFKVVAAGEPVKVPVLLMSASSPGHSLSMDRYGFSTAGDLAPGFYVAVSHFRRQTASLAFYYAN